MIGKVSCSIFFKKKELKITITILLNFHHLFPIASISLVPEEAPSSLKGYPVNSTAIRISWKSLPPSRHKEQLLGYRVKYRRLASKTYEKINTTSNITETVLTRLVAQTEYEIQVSGFNEIGHGPASKVLVVKTVSVGTLESLPSCFIQYVFHPYECIHVGQKSTCNTVRSQSHYSQFLMFN